MTAPPAETLVRACQELSRADLALARAFSEVGLPTWRTSEPSFSSLARIIVFQQISTRAADAIWHRVGQHLTDVTANAFLSATDEALRACGLSRPKVAHLRAIATAIVDGQLPLDRLASLEIDEARARLLAVKGVGPWTADVFLLATTGALDGFPSGDVGLMESYRRLRGDDEKLTSGDFTTAAERWRPYRGVAAHLLWDWINQERARDIAPSPRS